MYPAQIRVLSLVLRFKKYYLSLILLLIGHSILVELFASTYYTLYFLILAITIYFLNQNKLFFSNKILLLLVVYMAVIYFIFKLFEDTFYDLYIDMEMTFELSYISYEVCSALTVIHIFILFLLGYNRTKLI